MDHEVAAILEELRSAVRARQQQGAGDEGRSSLDLQLARCAEQLEITRVVSAHWPLSGRTLAERGLATIHKLVRRGLRWYINPIVEQQNAFNDVAARTLRLLIEAHAELRSQAAELQGASPPPNTPAPSEPPSDQGPLDAAMLQANVVARGQHEPLASLADLPLPPLTRLLAQRETVSAHWNLGGSTPLTHSRALLQQGVRQYLRWLINPIVEQQNAFNAAFAATALPAIAADAEARAMLAQRRARRAERSK